MESEKESQKPVLPKDLFRSQVTWFFYEVFKCRVALMVSGLSFVMIWPASKINFTYKNFSVSEFITFLFLDIAILSLPFCLFISKLRTNYKTELAQQVLELKPGVDIEKWELISSKLNTCFYEKRIWNTPYFFFNGERAYHTFRNDVLKSYLKGKFDDTANAYHIESSKTYLKSIKETFELYLKDDLPELSSEFELPREANRSRLFSTKRVSLMFILFVRHEAEALWLLMWFFRRGLSMTLIAVIVHQQLSLYYYLIHCHLTYRVMSVKQAIKFLAIITIVNPGQSLDEWDEVARYMNQYLADEGNFKCRDVKFFDGKHCLSFYKRYFETLSVGNSQLEYADSKEIVEIAQQHVA